LGGAEGIEFGFSVSRQNLEAEANKIYFKEKRQVRRFGCILGSGQQIKGRILAETKQPEAIAWQNPKS
jgi:hypothetical protein